EKLKNAFMSCSREKLETFHKRRVRSRTHVLARKGKKDAQWNPNQQEQTENTAASYSSSELRYSELPANSANRPFLDPAVTRHAGDFAACGVEPDGETL